jgi:mRNA interferase MazF
MAGLTRGQFVVAATPGNFGKPRPALVIQSDLFLRLPTVLIAPLTSMLRDDARLFRLDVLPTKKNGLREASQIAIDKTTVVRADKIGAIIGMADDDLLLRVNRALSLFLGII